MKLKLDIIESFVVQSDSKSSKDLLKEGQYDRVHQAIEAGVEKDKETILVGQLDFSIAMFDAKIAMDYLNLHMPKVRKFSFRTAYVNSRPACEAIGEQGFRMASFREILLFGSAHPKAQLSYPMLSEHWNMAGNMYQTILMSEEGNRVIDVMHHSFDYTCGWAFLLIKTS